MRFSIIVPVYKTEKYLRQCVDSVLSQSFTDFELVLVDDGSPDGCPKICDGYAEKDGRVKVIHKTNGGLSSARNFGLDAATGEYVLFIDSDDFYRDAGDLKKINDKLTEKPTDVLIFGYQKYFQLNSEFVEKPISEIPNGEDDALKFLMQSHIFVASAWNKVYRREFIEKNGLRFVVGQKSEDIEWCVKILLAKPVIGVLPQYIYVYRQQNENSITANITEKNIGDIYEVISKYAAEDSAYIKHFLAVQYVQLLAITNLVESKKIADILAGLKKLYGLLDYSWYPYVRKTSKLKFLGFKIVRKMLGVKLYGFKGCKR